MNHCRIMHPYHYCITVLIHEHRVCRDLLLFLGDRLPPTGHGKSCEFTHPIQRDGHVLVTYGQHVCLFSINLCLIVREKCILHFHFMVNFYSSIYSFIYSFIYFFFYFLILQASNHYVKINYFYIDILVISDIIWIEKKKKKNVDTSLIIR